MLEVYNKVRQVPDEAKKPIQGGRLKGMTDINPMWRIKILTEVFGPAGKGWYYEITDKQIIQGAKEEQVAFVDINLYVKYGDEWSKSIPGTGGSSFISSERNGLYTSDECFKMALTDALSVACKALGVGADVYFEKDRTKYSVSETKKEAVGQEKAEILSKLFTDLIDKGKIKPTARKDTMAKYKVSKLADLTPDQYGHILQGLKKAEQKDV
jgi:hypothetical protein